MGEERRSLSIDHQTIDLLPQHFHPVFLLHIQHDGKSNPVLIEIDLGILFYRILNNKQYFHHLAFF